MADRIAVLRDGRLVADQPAAGATETSIAQLMVGRDLSDLFTPPTAESGDDAMLTVDGPDDRQAVHDVSLSRPHAARWSASPG